MATKLKEITRLFDLKRASAVCNAKAKILKEESDMIIEGMMYGAIEISDEPEIIKRLEEIKSEIAQLNAELISYTSKCEVFLTEVKIKDLLGDIFEN